MVRAFDFILIQKLRAFGVDGPASVLRVPYWGHLIFNMFLNDSFYVIPNGTLYNYAVDNTLLHIDAKHDAMKAVFGNESCNL